MKRILNLIALLPIFFLSFVTAESRIEVKVIEHMRFEPMQTRAFGSKIIARGVLELTTDDDNDIGKIVEFAIPDVGLMTNRKNWIKIEELFVEDRDTPRVHERGRMLGDLEINEKRREIVMTKKRELVRFFGVLDRDRMTKEVEAELLEGDYIGAFPVRVSVYGTEE